MSGSTDDDYLARRRLRTDAAVERQENDSFVAPPG